MMDFFKNNRGPDKPDGESEVLDNRTIARLISHFPVGSKVSYYPEYRKEIQLDSVVIGYAINDKIIFTVTNLNCDAKSGLLEFDDQQEHYEFLTITRFNILLPVFNQSETSLDYVRREELLKVGGLVNGNTICLIAEQNGGQVPVIEAVVDKRAMLKHGYYANQTVAFLDVDPESLMLSDQRTHLRLKTRIPATIQVTKKGEYHLVNSTMIDFSDRSLRLEINDEFSDQALPKENSDIVVSFSLPGRSENISLLGNVFRIEGRVLVVMLSGMVNKGQHTRLGQIEILKIKANLLQHSNTITD